MMMMMMMMKMMMMMIGDVDDAEYATLVRLQTQCQILRETLSNLCDACYTPHFKRHTSQVTRHTSHVTRHT